MSTFVALLRGVNVGGRRRVPMTELRSLVTSLGFDDVRTLVQSGNVVFRGPAADAQLIAAGIEQRIAEVFGFDVAVLLRTPAELAETAANNPFLPHETDLSKLHVAFLDQEPAAEAVARLDPRRSPPTRSAFADARSSCTARTAPGARSSRSSISSAGSRSAAPPATGIPSPGCSR